MNQNMEHCSEIVTRSDSEDEDFAFESFDSESESETNLLPFPPMDWSHSVDSVTSEVINVRKRRVRLIPDSKSKDEEEYILDKIEWADKDLNPKPHYFDESRSGYVEGNPRPSTVLDCFELFFNVDLVNHIVIETNKYYMYTMQSEKKKKLSFA